MEKRIIELEKKSSFQEDTISELNKVVIEQHRQIEELQKTIKIIKTHLEGHGFVRNPEDEVPPPHY